MNLVKQGKDKFILFLPFNHKGKKERRENFGENFSPKVHLLQPKKATFIHHDNFSHHHHYHEMRKKRESKA